MVFRLLLRTGGLSLMMMSFSFVVLVLSHLFGKCYVPRVWLVFALDRWAEMVLFCGWDGQDGRMCGAAGGMGVRDGRPGRSRGRDALQRWRGDKQVKFLGWGPRSTLNMSFTELEPQYIGIHPARNALTIFSVT